MILHLRLQTGACRVVLCQARARADMKQSAVVQLCIWVRLHDQCGVAAPSCKELVPVHHQLLILPRLASKLMLFNTGISRISCQPCVHSTQEACVLDIDGAMLAILDSGQNINIGLEVQQDYW